MIVLYYLQYNSFYHSFYLYQNNKLFSTSRSLKNLTNIPESLNLSESRLAFEVTYKGKLVVRTKSMDIAVAYLNVILDKELNSG